MRILIVFTSGAFSTCAMKFNGGLTHRLGFSMPFASIPTRAVPRQDGRSYWLYSHDFLSGCPKPTKSVRSSGFFEQDDLLPIGRKLFDIDATQQTEASGMLHERADALRCFG